MLKLKHKFHHHKNLILLEYVYIDNMKVSSIASVGETIFHWLQGF